MQTFKFGVTLSGGGWFVAFNRNTYPEENHGWASSDDGTVTVTGPAATVSISYFSSDFGNPNSNFKNLPWYEQHSVAIATGIAVAVAVVLAAVFALRNRGKDSDSSTLNGN